MPYCQLHPKFITPEMRFVVRTCRGVEVEVDGKIVLIKEGEPFPTSSVSPYILRCLYEQLKIALADEAEARAMLDASRIQEANAVRPPESAPEVAPAAPVTPESKVLADLEALSKADLIRLCEKFNLPSDGSKPQFRDRLATVVV